MHGFGIHGSLDSHLEPLNEGGHWQKHVPPWFDGVPPFIHGFGLHGSLDSHLEPLKGVGH